VKIWPVEGGRAGMIVQSCGLLESSLGRVVQCKRMGESWPSGRIWVWTGANFSGVMGTSFEFQIK